MSEPPVPAALTIPLPEEPGPDAFGPILLVILAGTFVLMALAFYLPLFQLLRGIQ